MSGLGQNRAQKGNQQHPVRPEGVLPWEECVAFLDLSNLARFCASNPHRSPLAKSGRRVHGRGV